MRRALLTVLLGGLAVLAVLGTVSDPAWDWSAVAGSLARWTATVVTVFTVTLFVSLCALGWAHVYLTLRREWRQRGSRMSPGWGREEARRG